MAPGPWYFEEVKYALRDARIAVAVTNGRDQLPRAIDFSVIPGIREIPSPPGLPVEELPTCRLHERTVRCLLTMARMTVAYTSEVAGTCMMGETNCRESLHERTVRCLLTMARMTVAYTSEVAGTCMMGETNCRESLQELKDLGYIEYHKHDPFIDSHLMSARQMSGIGEKKDNEIFPYWRIRRPGVSAALRYWGVPAGMPFNFRSERNKLRDSEHRRRSRQWPAWLKKALPHATIYAGWNEVGVPGLGANPDSLAWGEMNGVETLFWMEVESGKSSRQLILDKTVSRWQKATTYAEYLDIHLVFVFLGRSWVRSAARMAFMAVPESCAVVVADWSAKNFGQLPYPKWGEVVFEAF